jgi:HEAT repeat protein
MSKNNWTAEKLFQRLLTNKSEKAYWENIVLLRKRPTSAVFEKCLELTKSDILKERAAGINVLAQLGTSPRPFYRQSIRLFFELLETEKEPDILGTILSSIAHNKNDLSKTQIDKLCTFADSDDDVIKDGLVFALLALDNTNAINVLIQLSSDKSSHIRNWATFGLGDMIERNTEKIRTALWNRTKDRHEETRFEAILGLAIRKDERVKDLITRELEKDNVGGNLLFKAIIAFDDQTFLPILKTLFENNKNDTSINANWLKELEHCINELKTDTRLPKRIKK